MFSDHGADSKGTREPTGKLRNEGKLEASARDAVQFLEARSGHEDMMGRWRTCGAYGALWGRWVPVEPLSDPLEAHQALWDRVGGEDPGAQGGRLFRLTLTRRCWRKPCRAAKFRESQRHSQMPGRSRGAALCRSPEHRAGPHIPLKIRDTTIPTPDPRLQIGP